MIPYSRQSIQKKDINSVIQVLKSNFLTQGPKVEQFEKSIRKITKAKYSVAVNSATSALHLACISLGLKKNEYLWTVPNTFVASANCALHCGAKVDFVDIDSNTLNISLEKLEIKLKNTIKKKLPKILVTVHFAGLPTMQDEIFKLSKKYKFKIIEDASHSIGAKYKSEPVGSCKWSDITIFSFHPVKIITTGEGGMLLTNKKYVAEKSRILRTHGIIKSKNNDWYYEQRYLGYNYRMSDIHASLGISQVRRLKKFISKRNEIAALYKRELSNLPLDFQQIDKNAISSYHLFVIKFKSKKLIANYSKIFNLLRKNKLWVNLHYLPLHLHPYYKKLGFKVGSYPEAENYSKKSISIPIFFELSKNVQLKTILKIKKIIKLHN
ncbi:UDP-4-amino-4,6-dideoxy-N-acetyl-beta-L-altrosamine transaminase [Candidatus Pelagibacter sp. Uisw_099_02]|uniref:UDP-4-amino-4, 6-dideoxy-N-acetyl-beta-L-altrosamine transaminase n=1 Tax=Candidatus Pelagibacter sp. Uisw_099_02 TaxID=3230981 RepID=UPI0039E9B7EE|tara:strand:+ start:7 stop:1149 length:1143 start_codon:yes stop_codon:yes gene_type:complete